MKKLTVTRDMLERWKDQCAKAAQACGDDANRLEAEAITLELRAPLIPEGMGGKPATDEQPGLFCEQRGLF